MATLPLVAHSSPDSIVAWSTGEGITVRQFMGDVSRLASLFPAGRHLLNMCSDRYRFSVGLAAAIVSCKVSLLPSTHTPGVIRQIKAFAPDVFCLTDSAACTMDLPQLRYPEQQVDRPGVWPVPRIDLQQQIAVVFTSGSTGTPQPHPKTWGALADSVQAEAFRLGLPPDAPCTLVGTVPPQHMYGFESTVLMAWRNGNAFSHEQPFYPDDVGRALNAVPAPRVLVSSPVHLRTMLVAGVTLPEMSLVVSATAPLSAKLAQDIESFFGAPLMEIYGSTETGLIATRRPTKAVEWQLLPGIQLIMDGDCAHARGGHIAASTPLGDRIEPRAGGNFLLHGRIEDLVNIAGKRHSLASLNHLLNSIPGVKDGAFYMPGEAAPGHTARLAACVVAPGMEASCLLAALREHVDPVFLPRPLLLVDALPRNSAGKLPRAALQALVQAHHHRKSG